MKDLNRLKEMNDGEWYDYNPFNWKEIIFYSFIVFSILYFLIRFLLA